jgi:sugar phosphate isomerase/epimerase
LAFKIGYSTYPLKTLEPFAALQLIKDVGYEALEVCLSEGWPTSPLLYTATQQSDLGKFAQDLGFESPILFGSIDVCASPADRSEMLDLTRKKIEMAHRLHYDDSRIIITTTPGHSAPSWDSGKDQILDAFLSLADIARENDVVIAIEAHAGTDFETPEKAVWLMEQANHPNLKLDLDISHFVVEGNEMVYSVDICAPHSSMIHIKDGEKMDGKVQYSLPGAGGIDITKFYEALSANGLGEMPVFAEVSVHQWNEPDYEARWTAEYCFNALDNARK